MPCPPPTPIYREAKNGQKEEAYLGSCDQWGKSQGWNPGLLDTLPLVPLTCRLPRGQYSVRIQMLGGSVQAPTNLVKCSFCTSRICKWGQHQGLAEASSVSVSALTSLSGAFPPGLDRGLRGKLLVPRPTVSNNLKITNVPFHQSTVKRHGKYIVAS